MGRYSSDDRDVMRQQVRWAKRAGIDGFIVSWKSTPCSIAASSGSPKSPRPSASSCS